MWYYLSGDTDSLINIFNNKCWGVRGVAVIWKQVKEYTVASTSFLHFSLSDLNMVFLYFLCCHSAIGQGQVNEEVTEQRTTNEDVFKVPLRYASLLVA